MLGTSTTNLIRLLQKKSISAKELTMYFLKRINTYNDKLNVYLTLMDDSSIPTEMPKGLLAGIPIAVKDNFSTAGMRTTASAKVLDSYVPPYDATVTSKLKLAGATILGKTNMDAWAHGSSTETSDYGPSKNPWDTTRAPGGSSGGSAVAVSAYLAPIAIGSETAGSVRQPAAWCGTVGLKPTYGRISRYGVIAMGSSLDCPGPLSATVEDSALMLKVLAGHDEFDATSAQRPVDDYVGFLKENKKYTIGVTDTYFEGVEDSVKEKVHESIKILEKMGHKIKKIDLIPPKYAISVYMIIQRAEVSSNLARFDGIRFGNDRSAFAREAKRRIMLGAYTLSHGYYDAYYKKAQKVRTLIIEDFKRVFKEVDMIVAPTTPVTALKLGEFEKYPFFGEMMDVLNEPASVAGIPAINVPGGMDKNGLPVGLQFIGNYFAEKDLLNISHQYEKETNYFDIVKNGFANYKD